MIVLVLLRPALQVLISLGRFVFGIGPEVDPRGSFVSGADAVAPIVLVGKAAAGITNHTRLKLLQIIDQRFANAVVIRNLRLLAHPDAIVDHGAEVLDKVTVDVWRDRADRLVDENLDARVGGLHAARYE